MAIQELKNNINSNEAGRSKKTGFHIGVTCPGCGGKLVLDSDFSVLQCDHCESVLRVLTPKTPVAYLAKPKATKREIRFRIDRYLKDNNLPLSDSSIVFKRILFPYWKIDAILLRVRNRVYEKMMGVDTEYTKATIIKQKKREITLSPYHHSSPAAVPMHGVPLSMGLRGDYLKVVPFAIENIPDDYSVLPIITDWHQAMVVVEKSIGHMGHLSLAEFGKNVTEIFHPSGSIVYFPYFIAECYGDSQFQRFIVDGVTGKIVDHASKPPPLDNDPESLSVDFSFGELNIDFHRCAECGDDLKPERTFVEICSNCQHTNFCGSKPSMFTGVHIADIETKRDTEYFPFWSFKLPENSSRELKNLFGGIFNSDWLTIPAFRNKHFESMYRLCKRITSVLPEIQLTHELPITPVSFIPVSISLDEAGTITKAVIRRRMLKNSSRNINQHLELDTSNLECRLIYIPFKPEHYFCVDAVLGVITFEKSSIT